MAKFCLKKKSKRQLAKTKYKIEKKVREHNRRVRKESKNIKKGKRSNKLVLVPTKCPFKEDVLNEIAEVKETKRIEIKQKLEKLKAEKKLQALAEKTNTLQDLVEDAKVKENLHQNFETPVEDSEYKSLENNKNNSVRAFYKEFKKVIQAADVILQVVDARDPQGTRCREVEDSVRQAGKKRLIIVLNKADLVPREILDRWLKYLRKSFPTIPFKASTQKQANRLSRQRFKWHAPKEKSLEISPCVGAELLMSILANYCRNKGIKTSIVVGVVGLPNVGKSSIINSLKRCRACQVGKTPGVTRVMQEIQLDKHIKLLDSPGVVLSSGGDDADVLRNASRFEQLIDPVGTASIILRRVTKKQMTDLYKVDDYNSPTQFFSALAKSIGRYKRGGVLNLNAAAKMLINDWNQGKIRYYTEPPEEDTQVHVSSAIVEEEAAEFDINNVAYESMEVGLLDTLQNYQKDIPKESTNMEVDSDDISIQIDTTLTKKQKKKLNVAESKVKTKTIRGKVVEEDNTPVSPGEINLKKIQKVQFKKTRKMKSRQERKTNELTDVIETLAL